MIDFSDRKVRIKLFGDEDALKDDPQRLREYYFKGLPYHQVISDDKLCLLVGYKGTGKSALLKVAHYEDLDREKASILINAYDLGKKESATKRETDLTTCVRDWKNQLSEEIVDRAFRCLDIRGVTLRDFNKAFKEEEYTDQDISFYLKLKFSNIGDNPLSDKAKKLLRSFLRDEKIAIYIDEVDTLWNGKKEDITNISALLIASRDICQSNPGVSFKIALRPDIYRIVKTSTAHGDKIEGSVVWQSWELHEILVLLVKRILTFVQEEVDEQELLHKSQYVLTNDYLSKIMYEKFQGRGKWEGSDGTGIPMHRFLLSIIRNRPRDMVKLCTAAAEQAGNSTPQKIATQHFDKILTNYSLGRIEDTIAEYQGELPKIKDLLLGMAPDQRKNVAQESYFYTTEALRKKIKQITLTNRFKFAEGNIATEDDLISFMYKIGFLTATRRDDNGALMRQYFEVNQYLSASIDFGFDWEVHPAFRWGLQPKDVFSVLSTIEPIAG
jgi:hypothetical protein